MKHIEANNYNMLSVRKAVILNFTYNSYSSREKLRKQNPHDLKMKQKM